MESGWTIGQDLPPSGCHCAAMSVLCPFESCDPGGSLKPCLADPLLKLGFGALSRVVVGDGAGARASSCVYVAAVQPTLPRLDTAAPEEVGSAGSSAGSVVGSAAMGSLMGSAVRSEAVGSVAVGSEVGSVAEGVAGSAGSAAGDSAEEAAAGPAVPV